MRADSFKASAELSSIPAPRCIACSGEGQVLHDGLADRLFGAPGTWRMRQCVDPHCGMAWLDPCPSADDIHLAYADYYTHSDIALQVRQRRHGLSKIWHKLIGRHVKKIRTVLERRYRFDVFADSSIGRAPPIHCLSGLYRIFAPQKAEVDFSYMYTPVRPAGRLLEVGCGSGWLLTLMRERGWQVEGVDFDRKAVDYARSQGLNVRCGGLRDQGYPSSQFDLIVGSHLIEHLHAPEQFLVECRRLLADNGRVVFVTPNVNSLGHRIFKHHWRGLEPPRHLQLFTAQSIATMALRAGFEHCETRFSMRDANHLFQASANLASRGSHRHGEKATLWRRFWTRALQWLEFGLMKFKPSLGEELIVILR